MRVAIDCRMKYGVGTLLKNVVPRIASEVGHVVLLGDQREMSTWRFSTKNVSFVEFAHRVYSWQEQLFFPKQAIKSVDIYHCPHFNIPLWGLGKTKLVVTINDLAHLSDALPTTLPERLYAKAFIRQAFRRSAHVLTLSNFSKDEIIRKISPDAAKITVAGCGVDRKIFSPRREPDFLRLAEIIQLPEDYILVSGSLRPHKNLSSLLHSFTLLKKEFHIRHKLVIAGQSDGFRLNTRILELPAQIAEDVRFVGFVTEDELSTLYSFCTVFVFPSIYEGFGLPVLEAMATGAPVVVSNRASLPEVVGDAGILVDPMNISEMAQAIYKVITDTSLRDEMRQKSLRQAAKFSWDDVASKFLEVYNRVLTKL